MVDQPSEVATRIKQLAGPAQLIDRSVSGDRRNPLPELLDVADHIPGRNLAGSSGTTVEQTAPIQEIEEVAVASRKI
jgi:hypothetical protein